MSVQIRNYKDEDFKMIAKWWTDVNENGPLPGMMPEESTFILEWDGVAIAALTALETNTKGISYLEGYIGNPMKGLASIRRELAPMLWNHAFKYLKDKGFERVLCVTSHEKLVTRYEQLGMTKLSSGYTALAKELV